jgi:hypothetical protein
MGASGASGSGTTLTARGRPKVGGTADFTIPGWLHISAAAAQALGANSLTYQQVFVETPITLDRLAIEVTTAAAAGKNARIGIYNADSDWQPTTLVAGSDAGPFLVDTTGVKAQTVDVTLPAGRYLFAMLLEATTSLRYFPGAIAGASAIAPTMGTDMHSVFNVNQAWGALPASGPAWTGRNFRFATVVCRIATVS